MRFTPFIGRCMYDVSKSAAHKHTHTHTAKQHNDVMVNTMRCNFPHVALGKDVGMLVCQCTAINKWEHRGKTACRYCILYRRRYGTAIARFIYNCKMFYELWRITSSYSCKFKNLLLFSYSYDVIAAL